MENDEKYVHGHLDPGIESTLELIKGVESLDTSTFSSSLEAPSSESSYGKIALSPGASSCSESEPKFDRLPAELLYHISSYLSPYDLVSLGKTCKLLSAVAKNELFWQELVQENVPGVKLQTPSPCASFRELFKAHDPHWFLSKNKLWFSDNPTAGRLMIAKYHPKTGSIGLHDFFVNKLPHQFSTWEDDDHVIVHSFEPEIRLKISCRQLKLDIYSKPPPSDLPAAEGRLKGEVSVSSGLSIHRENFENWLFMLAKAWAKDPGTQSTLDQWPPPNIPAKYRVDRTTIENQTSAARLSRPVNRSEINEESFRIRRWLREHPNGSARPVERVETWSTLDSRLYTPTEEKPYRGIFVGDYSGHGCEFLLVDQQDAAKTYDESDTLKRKRNEPFEEWEARKRARIHQGSLRAIKLTGDPNVPRGELSWVVDDLSDKGLAGYGKKAWSGARIVKARGQIANVGFINPKFIRTRLILISYNLLASYWVDFGHISFFRRVDIDALVAGESGAEK